MSQVSSRHRGSQRLGREVADLRRYLLVLDMDLLAMDEEHNLEQIDYLVAKQEQEPGEVVVLSLVTNQPKIHIERQM